MRVEGSIASIGLAVGPAKTSNSVAVGGKQSVSLGDVPTLGGRDTREFTPPIVIRAAVAPTVTFSSSPLRPDLFKGGQNLLQMKKRKGLHKDKPTDTSVNRKKRRLVLKFRFNDKDALRRVTGQLTPRVNLPTGPVSAFEAVIVWFMG